MMRQVLRNRRTAAAAEKSINAYYRRKGQPVQVSLHHRGGAFKVWATVDLPSGRWLVWRAEYGSAGPLRSWTLSDAVITEVNALVRAASAPLREGSRELGAA